MGLGSGYPSASIMMIINLIFWTDYPTCASVQMQGDAHSQSSTFSKDMNSEQLALWLRNYPSLSEVEYEEDISKLRGTLPDTVLINNIMLVTIVVIILLFYLDARINGHIFLSLNESRLERFSVSVGFQFAVMNIIKDMVSSWKSLV